MEKQQAIINLLQEYNTRGNIPLKKQLVAKIDEISNGVESDHARMIHEELLKLESRLQSEITRVEESVKSQISKPQ